MIVNDLYVVRVAVLPAETDSPLLVDSYAVLPAPIVRELLEAVRRRNPQVFERIGSVQDKELSQRDPLETSELAGSLALKDLLRLTATEALDHGLSITRCDNTVKRY